MSHSCSLDLLPVELLHILFTYFLAHEILLTFSDVSDYINAILLNYSAYRFDLKSIRKSDFDRIRHIHPKQVITLTLSDDNNTLVQSELFLSYFQIPQFTRLRSLTLNQIEFKSLKTIFSNLHTLEQLRVLSFDIETIRHRFPAWNDDPLNGPNQLKSFLFNIYTRVLPQLNRICLNSSADLISIPLPYLRQLKLAKFSFDELETIFQNSPQLKSLDICLDMSVLNSAFILPSNQLLRLDLEIKNRRISRDQIEQLLSNLPHLKHLNLQASAGEDITDGHFWQILTNSFITFNFKFDAILIDIQKTLNSFRTPFWLVEKRWYVAFQNGCLFSLPHFAPVHMDSLNISQFGSTAPDHLVIYRNLNKFTVSTMPTNHHYRLTHIKTLVLEFSISLKILESIIDLNHVEHLIVSSLDSLLTLVPLDCTLPRVYKLTVRNSVTIDIIERIRRYRFEQIRILQIRVADKHTDYIIEELFLLFPRTKHLIYKSHIDSVGMMIRLMNGFKYLLNASFYADCLFYQNESNFCRNPNLIIQDLQRQTQDDITCRVYHVVNTTLPLSIHWRIEKQPSISPTVIYWPWKRGYRWYRLKHILLQFLNHNLIFIQYLIQFLIYLSIVVITHTHYRTFESYFICFCLIQTVLITILYDSFYRLFISIKNDNIYIACAGKIYVWFVFFIVMFLFLMTSQIVYDYII